MKRVLTAVAVALAPLAASVFPVAPTAAQSAPEITILHGVGPGANFATFYFGPPDATEWEEVLRGVQYPWLTHMPDLAAGEYNVLACTFLLEAPATISGCPEGSTALNGNTGTNVSVAPGDTVALVYAGPDEPLAGRPVVTVFPRETGCVPAGQARLAFDHGAALGPVDILVDGEVVADGFSWGDALALDVRAVNHEVEVRLEADDSTVFGPDVLDTAAPDIRYLSLVGNPAADADVRLLTSNGGFGTACPPETASTSTTSTTTPVVDPPPAPPQAQPADFTG